MITTHICYDMKKAKCINITNSCLKLNKIYDVDLEYGHNNGENYYNIIGIFGIWSTKRFEVVDLTMKNNE